MIASTEHVAFQHYPSRIEEVGPNYMVVAMPMRKGIPILLEPRQEFTGKIFDASGVYSFKSVFLGKKLRPIPIWIISTPFDLQKIQQRSFVRLDVAVPVILEYPSPEDDSQMVTLNLTTKDISGGGLQAISQMPLKHGLAVELKVSLPEFGSLEFKGEVIRVHKPQADRPLFWIAIKFVDIQENSRDKLIRFIFKKQLEQRQKGL